VLETQGRGNVLKVDATVFLHGHKALVLRLLEHDALVHVNVVVFLLCDRSNTQRWVDAETDGNGCPTATTTTTKRNADT
jgi:hypothetical protein